MKIMRLCMAALLSTAAMLAACDPYPKSWKTPNMTNLSPRLQPLFARTKTVCFGRFVIDVPETMELIWGQAMTPLTVDVFEDSGQLVVERVAHREAELKADIRFPTFKKLPMYFETLVGAKQGQRIVISQREADTDGEFRIESFSAMGKDLLLVSTFADQRDKERTLTEVNEMVLRLRPHLETEVPAEPGLCIDHAFLPDKPGAGKEKPDPEHIRIGFRLKQFPDAHLSIYTAPANPHDTSGDSLEGQLKRTEEEAKKSGKGNPYAALKFFRRDKRQIHDWKTGYEILTRTPDEEGSHGHHDFWMKFTGVAYDVFNPYADIQFKTGVEHDGAGATKPSLTDEEAVALWDKLTASIRVRPTGGGVKTSDATPPNAPLGELAATGRACVQTGWWESVDDDTVNAARRQHIKAGERMPQVAKLGKAGLLDRLRGEQPVYRGPTMWKLVGYGTPPEAPIATGTTPPVAVALMDTTPAGETPVTASPRDADDTPPTDKA
ncbi:MAG: hypothetical protein JF606_05835 [Burkholderiales bacterium]|jgi:hypothetical protein|nr:hypothetical protein [Burkholderiales bacterium]